MSRISWPRSLQDANQSQCDGKLLPSHTYRDVPPCKLTKCKKHSSHLTCYATSDTSSRKDGAQRNDVDCSLEQHPAADLPGQAECVTLPVHVASMLPTPESLQQRQPSSYAGGECRALKCRKGRRSPLFRGLAVTPMP